MNKLLTAFILSSASLFAISCDDDDDEKVVPEAELPQDARNFINLHFPEQSIKVVTFDKEGDDYDVLLENDFILEFDKAGIWNEVDGRGRAIPTSIIDELPESIATYLSENYTSDSAIKVDIEAGHYEVELTTRVELIFDVNGTFIRLDN